VRRRAIIVVTQRAASVQYSSGGSAQAAARGGDSPESDYFVAVLQAVEEGLEKLVELHDFVGRE
jgi:hypothetical protein